MPKPLLLSDDDIRRDLSAADALLWTEEALLRRARGQLQSPPRAKVPLSAGSLVFTAGASGEDWFGFRAYDTLETSNGQGLVVAYDAVTGQVIAVAVGNELGARRTGALGGVAAKHLSHGHVRSVGVIGAGTQAWTQIWALGAFGRPDDIRIYSRTPSSRAMFAQRAVEELGLDARAVDSPQAAVDGADLVIVATNSDTPVLETGWLKRDVVVTTLGPKQVGRAEFSTDLATEAAFVVTDSPAQLKSYDPPALVADAVAPADLAQVVSGAVEVPRSGRRVYLSVGLSGTEVHLLGRLAAHYV